MQCTVRVREGGSVVVEDGHSPSTQVMSHPPHTAISHDYNTVNPCGPPPCRLKVTWMLYVCM